MSETCSQWGSRFILSARCSTWVWARSKRSVWVKKKNVGMQRLRVSLSVYLSRDLSYYSECWEEAPREIRVLQSAELRSTHRAQLRGAAKRGWEAPWGRKPRRKDVLEMSCLPLSKRSANAKRKEAFLSAEMPKRMYYYYLSVFHIHLLLYIIIIHIILYYYYYYCKNAKSSERRENAYSQRAQERAIQRRSKRGKRRTRADERKEPPTRVRQENALRKTKESDMTYRMQEAGLSIIIIIIYAHPPWVRQARGSGHIERYYTLYYYYYN